MIEEVKNQILIRLKEQDEKIKRAQRRNDYAACIEGIAAKAELTRLLNYVQSGIRRGK